MSKLYNCRVDGDQHRISKFDADLNVESSYLTNGRECDCPAGHRPICRHRTMLPRFLAKSGADRGLYFHNFEQNQWVRASVGDDCAEGAEVEAPNLTATEVNERIKNYRGPMPGDGLLGELVDQSLNQLAAHGFTMLDLAKPTPESSVNRSFDRSTAPLRRPQ